MNNETFEDRLLARLAELDAARPAVQPRRRPLTRRPAVLVTAAAAAVLVAAGAIGAIGFGGAGRQSGTLVDSPDGPVTVKPASFTVVKNADGTVTFTVHDLLDLSGATGALNDAGIVGRVLTSTPDCITGPNVVPIDPNDLYPPDTLHRLGDKGDLAGNNTVTISSSFYPSGGGLLVAVHGGYERYDNDKLHLLIGYFAYVDADRIPTCVNFVDPGTGDVPAWPPTPGRR